MESAIAAAPTGTPPVQLTAAKTDQGVGGVEGGADTAGVCEDQFDGSGVFPDTAELTNLEKDEWRCCVLSHC